jgi:uncharacterized protein YjbI with pentapeptide repeats
MQPLCTIKNLKGHHPNTPPLWETSRAQHCQGKRYVWAMNMTAQKLLVAYANGARNFSGAKLYGANLSIAVYSQPGMSSTCNANIGLK